MFTKGQKVRNNYGKLLTVLSCNDCVVIVEEECFGHYHPTKLHAV